MFSHVYPQQSTQWPIEWVGWQQEWDNRGNHLLIGFRSRVQSRRVTSQTSPQSLSEFDLSFLSSERMLASQSDCE